MNYFWFKKNLQTSITMPRVHDQLYPNFVFAETRFPTEVVNGLISLGHKVCRCVYIEKSVSEEYRISGLAFALRPRKLAPLSQPIRCKTKINHNCAKSVQSIFQLSDKSNSGLRWCYFISLSDYWECLILSFPQRKCFFSPASKRAFPRLFARSPFALMSSPSSHNRCLTYGNLHEG